MKNYLFTARFLGTAYHGYQVQKNALSICETLQNAIEGIIGIREDIIGCSRTDAGVHADCFCFSMKSGTGIPPEGLVRGLNAKLPSDIAIYACREVPMDFHARYDATAKSYRYLILNEKSRDPFYEGRALHCSLPLDESLMDEAARHFIGEHDFSAFCAAGSEVRDKVRTIYEAGVFRDGNLVEFRVKGSGFLYHMVRIMAGTLLEVASGGISPEEIPEIIAGGDRARAGTTAPAHGLYLSGVYYER